METRTERNGEVTKRFNLKSGTAGDRLAFAIPGHLGVTVQQVQDAQTEYDRYFNYNLSQYEIITGT